MCLSSGPPKVPGGAGAIHHKHCRDGVWELRVDVGPGYRVYYAQAGKQLVLLLCGGSKSSQQADINRACEFWQDWKSR